MNIVPMADQKKDTKQNAMTEEQRQAFQEFFSDSEFEDEAFDDIDDMDQSEDDEDEDDNEMLFVLETVFDALTDMVSRQVSSTTIESTLITSWLQTVVMNCDESEDFFEAQSENFPEMIGQLMTKLDETFNAFPAVTEELEEADNTLLIEMKKSIEALSKDPATAAEADQEKQMASDKFMELFDVFEKMNAHLLDVESAFLYYWVLFKTLNHKDSNERLKKMGHYWGDIFEQMAIYSRNLMGIKDFFE